MRTVWTFTWRGAALLALVAFVGQLASASSDAVTYRLGLALGAALVGAAAGGVLGLAAGAVAALLRRNT